MSLTARQQLTTSLAARYRAASRSAKQIILDEFTAATGYHRKYAVRVLGRIEPQKAMDKARWRARVYDDGVKEALVFVWRASNRLCLKRLVPFLPEFVGVLERCGHLSLSAETRTRLLAISPASVDRLLVDLRRRGRKRAFGATRPGTLLKHQVPVRTFADCDDLAPGFVEADLVARLAARRLTARSSTRSC